MSENFRPILGNGKEYVTPYQKKIGAPKKDTRPSYSEASKKLLSEISQVKEQINKTPQEYRMEEIVINLKMNVDYSSKSYHPRTLINQSDAIEVGSKKWTKKVISNGKEKNKIGKNIFLRINEEKLIYLENLLNQQEEQLLKGFIDDVRSIEEFYFDDHKEFVDIFGEDWIAGRTEIVIHPQDSLEGDVVERLLHLIDKYGGDSSKAKVRSYNPGPIFISAYLEKETLMKIMPFNPIRTVHPFEFRGLPRTRGALTNFSLPLTNDSTQKSPITVGIFDGGVDENISLLKNYVVEHNPISTPKHPEYMQHGIGVAGAALFGDLSNYSSKNILPIPSVNIESFRVFPLSDPKDIDLYEVIDIIEKVVPQNPHIKVFNLSLGPYGPIEDDYVSRFTYVIDKLSEDNKRWFSIAVGNDGDMKDKDDCRIQAPSDSVNNIGVGAYSYSDSEIVRAPYSCIGDGREGGKVKPDILELGGCDKNPLHLIGVDGQNKWFAAGTSFAAPIIASKGAEVMGRCNTVDPLLSRVLLIHSAKHPKGKHDQEHGYGIVPKDIDEILGCTGNRVTVTYQGSIRPTKFAKLDIPFIDYLNYSGKIEVEWTIGIVTKTNSLNTEDYTLSCLEDTFYPNSNIYSLRPPKGSSKNLHILNEKEEISRLQDLGWKMSKAPVADSRNKNKYRTEQERKSDFKWDTIMKRKVIFSKYEQLDQPYLVLHAMERGDNSGEFVNYSVAVSVKYCDYKGDAYRETLKTYNKLQALKVRNINEILVK